MAIDIKDNEQKIIEDILDGYKKKYSFYYYGSRTKGLSEKTSDLDILIKGKQEMPLYELQELKEKFDNSRLPYIVNFSDYHKINLDFFMRICSDLIPYNWRDVKLGDVCNFSSEKTEVSKLSLNNYISTENMLPNKAGVCCSANLPNTFHAVAFHVGNILVSNIRPYFKKIWYADFNGGCSNDVLVFQANENIDNNFLYYVLSSNSFVDYDVAMAKGTKMPRGDKAAIMQYQFLLPPLDIQKKIAAVLGALDDKIELNNKINNNLEQQAQALFKSWFMDFEPFGGKMPADWKVGKLGEIAEIIMGQSPNGSTYNEEKNGCIFFQGRAEFGARFPKVRLYTTEPKRMANKGDVLMSVRAPVGDFNMAMEDCCIGRGLCAIRSKQNYQSFILYTVWASQDKLNVFNGEGTVFGSVNKDSLYNMLIIIPTNKIMQQFEYICSKLDMLIWNNSLENTKLAAIRDTLLPKLMSGEIDVSNVNISELPSADKSQLIEDDSVKF